MIKLCKKFLDLVLDFIFDLICTELLIFWNWFVLWTGIDEDLEFDTECGLIKMSPKELF